MIDVMSRLVAIEQQLRRLYQRIVNTHATGRVVLVDDTGPVQKMQVRLPMGEIIDAAASAQQFGLASNMPVDGDVTISFLEGNRSKAIITATGHQAYRPRSLVIGGTVLHDSGVESITLDPAGTITINSAHTVVIKAADKVRIEAPTLECTGEIIAQCDGAAIHLSTHRHDGVQSGGGTSNKPVAGS